MHKEFTPRPLYGSPRPEPEQPAQPIVPVRVVHHVTTEPVVALLWWTVIRDLILMVAAVLIVIVIVKGWLALNELQHKLQDLSTMFGGAGE